MTGASLKRTLFWGAGRLNQKSVDGRRSDREPP